MTSESKTDAVEVDEDDSVTADDSEQAADAADSSSQTADTDPAETTTQAKPRGGIVGRSVQRVRSRLGAVLLAAALIASAGTAAWLYFKEYRPDQQTNAAAATVALDAAKNGTVALLSYSPESLDKDFANAKSHLTGDFLSYYTQFTEQIVTPAAKQKSVKTTAAVVQAAVSDLHPDSATVLVFINQNTVSKENPDGAFAASSVKVGMKKINGTWLISSFDPV